MSLMPSTHAYSDFVATSEKLGNIGGVKAIGAHLMDPKGDMMFVAMISMMVITFILGIVL